uniref:Small, acid-soluble spore protein, alpha/beta type n=1 Tax=Loa loa TaxID=7209 RepID=A0A1I7VBX1_LOALO
MSVLCEAQVIYVLYNHVSCNADWQMLVMTGKVKQNFKERPDENINETKLQARRRGMEGSDGMEEGKRTRQK